MPFQPGEVTNKKGRPAKKQSEIDAEMLLKTGALAAAERLMREVGNDDSAIALKAAIEVLNRTLGKPAEQKQGADSSEGLIKVLGALIGQNNPGAAMGKSGKPGPE
jgi:hypothetical protein